MKSILLTLIGAVAALAIPLAAHAGYSKSQTSYPNNQYQNYYGQNPYDYGNEYDMNNYGNNGTRYLTERDYIPQPSTNTNYQSNYQSNYQTQSQTVNVIVAPAMPPQEKRPPFIRRVGQALIAREIFGLPIGGLMF